MSAPRSLASDQPGRLYRGRTDEARRAERRTQLIAAAVTVYGGVGFRNVTVKAVCQAAGLTERYFYEAFSNSDDLLLATYDAVNEDLIAAILQAGADQPTPEARNAAMMEAFFAALGRKPLAARLFLVEARGISLAVDAAVWAWHDRFGALIAEGLADKPPSRLLLRGTVGGLLHIAIAWLDGGMKEPLETVTADALRLCAGLRR